MQQICGIMVTMTTYGTWLRGDQRGWVDEGRILPAVPELESDDRMRMKYPVFTFLSDDWFEIGAAIVESLTSRIQQRLLALTVQTWHVHFVVADSEHPIAEVVKCAKDAVRYHLRPGRPIWTDGYDKRFCFGEMSLMNRIEYVERHNTERHRPAKPWSFVPS